jgi:hypothetical protein
MLETIQDMGQLAEPELTGSTTTARVLHEADGGLGFGGHHEDRSRSREPASRRAARDLPPWLSSVNAKSRRIRRASA